MRADLDKIGGDSTPVFDKDDVVLTLVLATDEAEAADRLDIRYAMADSDSVLNINHQ